MGAVVRAPSGERRGLSLLSAGENRLAPPVVDIRRRHMADPFVIAPVVIELDAPMSAHRLSGLVYTNRYERF